MNYFVRLLLGRPRIVPGTNAGFSLFYTVQAQGQTQFVPGTNRGERAAEKVCVKKVMCLFRSPLPISHHVKCLCHLLVLQHQGMDASKCARSFALKLQDLWLGKQVMAAFVLPYAKLLTGRFHKESPTEDSVSE